MPLTSKGREILKSLSSEYGEKKGKEVFYAGVNEGKFTGVDATFDAALDEAQARVDAISDKVNTTLADGGVHSRLPERHLSEKEER
jgi:hypothetical protein